MFLDTAIAKLAGISIPARTDNLSSEEKEERCRKLTMSVMAITISGWASNFNEKERGNYYSFILKGVPDNFLKEVFQIRAASEMLTVNVETIRRKIRDKKIPVLNEGKVNTGVGYEITGDAVIALAKKSYQKESVLAYCIEKYPREMVISLIQLLIDEGKGFKNLTSTMVKALVSLAFVAEWKLEDIPKGKIVETDEDIRENYAIYLENKKGSLENDKNEEVDFTQKEREYLDRIENLEKENAELFEENLYLKIISNKLNLKLLTVDLEKIEKDNKNIEYRKLVRKICMIRERIEYLDELKENQEEFNQQGREEWPSGII